MSTIKYRPDIDGLRALAVLPVIFFHADWNLFSGGYIGVDVFFVISGYLITLLIMREVQTGTFKFSSFWLRRVRRLLPALFAMLLISMIAGWFLFLPQDYIEFSQSALAQSAFVSNIYFWRLSGYFDGAVIYKPLLHTWTLSVEEQYYLLFPPVFVLLLKYARKLLIPLVIAGFILSLTISIWAVQLYPTAAFYLLPARGWEFLIGSFASLATLSKDYEFCPKGKIAEILSLAGLGFISYAVFLFDKDTLFPGLSALLPCVGAVLFIWANSRTLTITGKALSNKYLVWIGLISYSLYLWHWPIFVFYNYTFPHGLNASQYAFAIAITFALASLSYHYIETPIRKLRAPSYTPQILFYTGCALSILVLSNALIKFSNGVPARFSPQVLQYAAAVNDHNPHQKACNRPSLKDIKERKLCQTNPHKGKPVDFILWGDSHADAIGPAFYELSQKYGVNGYIATYDGCRPVLNIRIKTKPKTDYCPQFNQEILSLIREDKIKNVFLVASWSSWMINRNLQYTKDGLVKLLETKEDKTTYLDKILTAQTRTLQQAGSQTYIMRTVPTIYDFDPPRVLALNEHLQRPPPVLALNKYNAQRQDLNNIFKKLKNTESVTVIDPKGMLCNNESCDVGHDDRSLYYNSGHVSAYGAHYLSALFDDHFQNIAQ